MIIQPEAVSYMATPTNASVLASQMSGEIAVGKNAKPSRGAGCREVGAQAHGGLCVIASCAKRAVGCGDSPITS